MAKEIRHFEISLEKIIEIDVLIEKEMSQEELYKAIYKHFEEYGDDWSVDRKVISVMPGQRYSLNEFMVKSIGVRNLTVIQFHDDDCDDDDNFSIDHVVEYNRKALNKILKKENSK